MKSHTGFEQRSAFGLFQCLILALLLVWSLAAAPQSATASGKSESEMIYQEAMRAYQRGEYEPARQLLLPLAEQGITKAQFNVGVMYERGLGFPRDEARAVSWYRKAAEQGNMTAQFNMGVMLANGRGAAKDDAGARMWYRKAAEQGHAASQFHTALYFATENNAIEAANWYRKSADQGYAKAQTNLGRMYSRGEGVARDDVEAVKWYQLSAEQGRASGQVNLGLKLLAGEGIARDPVSAYMWLSLAARSEESKLAAAKLAELEKMLPPEQIERAKKLAEACKAREYKNCL